MEILGEIRTFRTRAETPSNIQNPDGIIWHKLAGLSLGCQNLLVIFILWKDFDSFVLFIFLWHEVFCKDINELPHAHHLIMCLLAHTTTSSLLFFSSTFLLDTPPYVAVATSFLHIPIPPTSSCFSIQNTTFCYSLTKSLPAWWASQL